MHTHAEIYLESNENWQEQVEDILSQYDANLEIQEEKDEDGNLYWCNPNGIFDWYEIGGRWTGSHGNYNPEEDIRNYEKCRLCDGTGLRNDEIGLKHRQENPDYKCNGCYHYNRDTGVDEPGFFGVGMALKWPTDWFNHESNIIPIEEIDEKLDCGTIFFNGDYWENEEWDYDNKKFKPNKDFNGNVKEFLTKNNITTGFLVTVDYHW